MIFSKIFFLSYAFGQKHKSVQRGRGTRKLVLFSFPLKVVGFICWQPEMHTKGYTNNKYYKERKGERERETREDRKGEEQAGISNYK